MNNSVFTAIQHSDIPERLKKVANKLSLSFSETKSADLEKAVQLAYLLYLYDKLDFAEQIVNELSHIEFNGNYNYWTWIEMALILNIRINRINSELAIVDVLKNKVLSPLSIGNEAQVRINNRVFKRILQGDTLPLDKVKRAMDAGDVNDEVFWRTVYLKKLMKISEMGGSDEYPAAQAEVEIKNNEIRVKDLLNNINLNSLF